MERGEGMGRRGQEKRPIAERCLHARELSSRVPPREYSSSPGIKCGWMSHRFIPIPVISYLRGAAQGVTKGEERTEGFVNGTG